jgi:hypothetical protein
VSRDQSHRAAVELLRVCGAGGVEHPGGTLLAHLLRVERMLEVWGAPDALRLAGLCHACYGTDGFATSLLDLPRRTDLVDAIGARAERMVYRYAACDRAKVYPQLGRGDPITFRDRFRDVEDEVPAAELAWFAELTAANELDLARHNPEFARRHGPGLLEFFSRTRGLLTAAAWQECRAVLG